MVLTSLSIFIIYEKNNPNKYTYLLIGDGLNLENYYDKINEYLTNANKSIDFYNYSKKNMSIKELTTDLIYLDNKDLKSYLQKSNLVILSIGEKEINDNEKISNIKQDFYNLINELKKNNPNICILSKYQLNNEINSNITNINKIYKEIAKENNLIYLNIENISVLNDNYPSKKGYKDVSNLIIKAINLKDK